MPTYRFLAVAGLCLISGGCQTARFGIYPDHLAEFPERPISPQEAVRAAQPFLDQSYALFRESSRDLSDSGEPRIHVRLKGKYYYVVKHNGVSMNANYGFDHAVRVHATTGVVDPPK